MLANLLAISRIFMLSTSILAHLMYTNLLWSNQSMILCFIWDIVFCQGLDDPNLVKFLANAYFTAYH